MSSKRKHSEIVDLIQGIDPDILKSVLVESLERSIKKPKQQRGFHTTEVTLDQYKSVVERLDLDVIKKIARFYFSGADVDNLGAALGEMKGSLGKDQLIEKIAFSPDEAARLRADHYQGNAHPILQFYDYARTISNFLARLREWEHRAKSESSTSGQLSSESSSELHKNIHDNMITDDVRPYQFVDVELATPDYYSDKKELWRTGHKLKDKTIYDPLLRCLNIYVPGGAGAVEKTDTMTGHVRPKTDYEVCVTEAYLLNHDIINEFFAIEQGLFRVFSCSAPVFDSKVGAGQAGIASEFKGGTEKIREGNWINSFRDADQVLLPLVNHDNGNPIIDKAQPLCIYFQPKYTNIINYPHSWMDYWLDTYSGMTQPQKVRPVLSPHLHNGKGGAIGFVNWNVTGLAIAPGAALDNDTDVRPFYAYPDFGRLAADPGHSISLPVNRVDAIAFYPISGHDATQSNFALRVNSTKHAIRYKQKISKLVENAPLPRASDGKMAEQMRREWGNDTVWVPRLAMHPIRRPLPSSSEQGRQWSYYEACRIQPDEVFAAMSKCTSHPIHACPRLSKAYTESGAMAYVRSKLIETLSRVYERYRSDMSTTAGVPTDFVGAERDNRVNNLVERNCAPGHELVFRNQKGDIVPESEAVYMGTDGRTYLKSGYPKELVKCMPKQQIVKPGELASGREEGRSVSQIQLDLDRGKNTVGVKPDLTPYSSFGSDGVSVPVQAPRDENGRDLKHVSRQRAVTTTESAPSEIKLEPIQPQGNPFEGLESKGFKALTNNGQSSAEKTGLIDNNRRHIYRDPSTGQHFVIDKQRNRRITLSDSDVRNYQAEWMALVYDDNE